MVPGKVQGHCNTLPPSPLHPLDHKLSKRDSKSWLTPPVFTKAPGRAWPKLGAGTQSRFSRLVLESQLLEPSPLSPRVCTGGLLESEELERVDSCVRCWVLKQCLNCWATQLHCHRRYVLVCSISLAQKSSTAWYLIHVESNRLPRFFCPQEMPWFCAIRLTAQGMKSHFHPPVLGWRNSLKYK